MSASPPQPPDSGRASVRLKIISGPHAGEQFVFESYDTLIVGRAADAQWSLAKDPHFSRYHFRVEANPPQCRLTDLVSANGTRVNGNKVNDVHLQHGDKIECGATVFAVSITPGTSAADAKTLDVPLEYRESGGPADASTSATHILQVGDFRLTRQLGSGGMGVVYHGFHGRTGREVAVKVIRPSGFATATAMQIFLREASILAKLQHPRIVEYIHLGLHEGRMYLVMEYLPTLDFPELLRTQSRDKQIRLVTGVMCRALEALQYAHDRDIVHRDVKPTNLLVFKRDGRLQMKLADFGLSKQYHGAGIGAISNENDLRGTLGYMAPEQLKDSRCAKPPCDIYSAGACAYYLLCGKLPHDTTTPSIAFASTLNSRPRPLQERDPDLPSELCAAVDRALSPEPSDRFSSAQHMRQALLKFTEK